MLAADEGIIRIDAARPVNLFIQSSVPAIHAKAAQPGAPGMTGAGVAVGIVDLGFDFRHPDLRDAAGASRIAFLWDQNLDPVGYENWPSGFSEGVEYTKAQIDAQLQQQTPRVPIRHAAQAGAHGTLVAGIAAGTGVGRGALGRVGVAPESTLILVSLGKPSATEADSHWGYILDAITYIYRKADALGLPCVINLSMGSNDGAHDGETAVERAIDQLLLEPGRALVAAAGNEADKRTHAVGVGALGATAVLRWMIGGPAGACVCDVPAQMEIWFSPADAYEITLKSPMGENVQPVSRGRNLTGVLSDGTKFSVEYEPFCPENGLSRIFLRLSPGNLSTLPSGEWRVELKCIQASVGRLDAWIERAPNSVDPSVYRQSEFHQGDCSRYCTVTTPATAKRAIAVGAFDHSTGNLAPFSAWGPTRDERRKPDVLAPGVSIAAANATSAPDRHVTGDGTSMAAPHITGIVAQMLQASPHLTSGQIAEILAGSATRSAQGYQPDTGWGVANGRAALSLLY